MKTLVLPTALELESGEKLEGVEVAYQTWGTLNATRSNVVWVCHALTANADVEDWWPGILSGPEAPYSTTEHFVVCANVLGSCYGTTGPLSDNPGNSRPYYHDFPHITIRDIMRVHQALARQLDIHQISCLIGASMGGQQAMEWAIDKPNQIDRLVLLATNAQHSPWGIAFNESQRMAIELDPSWKNNDSDAGLEGLKAARSVALLSYRSHMAYSQSQQDHTNRVSDFRASSYQRYQGEKLADRFNAFSYYRLSQAMDSHNVGRGRGSVGLALSRIKAHTLVIGIDSDLLFPVKEQRYLARHIPNSELKILHSDYGHDGFLIETDKIAATLRAHQETLAITL